MPLYRDCGDGSLLRIPSRLVQLGVHAEYLVKGDKVPKEIAWRTPALSQTKKLCSIQNTKKGATILGQLSATGLSTIRYKSHFNQHAGLRGCVFLAVQLPTVALPVSYSVSYAGRCNDEPPPRHKSPIYPDATRHSGEWGALSGMYRDDLDRTDGVPLARNNASASVS